MSQSSSILQILIASGGIGGLAPAYVLAEDGRQMNVLEQSSVFARCPAAGRCDPAHNNNEIR